jgi:hypothetical protein
MKRLAGSALLSVAVWSTAPAAFAETGDELSDVTAPSSADPDEGRRYVVGTDIYRPDRGDPSSYRPRVDDEFSGATPYEDTFGNGERYQVGFELDWQALRIPHFGSLGPGFGFGYTKASASAPLESSGRPSAEKTSLWVMPMYLVAVLRVDVLARDFHIPLVPYGKAGLGYALWRAGGNDGVPRSNGVKGEGSEYGYHLAVGGMFLLNSFHAQAAIDMDNTTGINAAYIFGEYFLSRIDSFGNGMQVGANSWVVGLAFEY